MSEEQPTTFGGFPIPTKNFFHLPNNMTDIIARIDNLSELKIVIYLARHTWGFQEYGIYKAISVDEFVCGRKQKKMGPDGKDIMVRMDEGTGLSEPSVKDGLKRGIKHGYILCKVDDKDQGRVKKYYTLRMMASEEEGGKNLTGQESYPVSNLPSEVKNLTPRGKTSYPRTEKETKESNSRKTKRENALSSIDETRTLTNSPSSIDTQPEAPSSEQREATAPLSEENGTTEPALPEIEAQREEKASVQANGVSDSQKNTGKPGNGSRKPRKPTVSDDQRKRIDHVYDVFDALGCEVTGAENYRYQRTKSDDEHILNWFKCSPTEEMLGKIYRKLWNTPKDTKSGFDWKENMTIRAVLRQYDRLTLGIKANEQPNIPANTKQIVETVANIAGYTQKTVDLALSQQDAPAMRHLGPRRNRKGA